MKTLIRSLWALSFACSIFFIGCSNATDPVTTENITSSEDNALIDGEFSVLFATASAQGDVSNETAANRKSNSIAGKNEKCDLLPICATVDNDTTKNEITIDYGNQNCLCSDGLMRRGKIMINYTGTWKSIGSIIEVTLKDYYVQDLKVTGKKTVTIFSTTSFIVLVEDATMITPKGTISWASNHTITQTKGYSTKNTTSDDEFSILGGSTGTNSEGVKYTATIDNLNPLIKRVSCKQKDFSAGILTIQNDKGKTLVINYDPQNTKGCNKNSTCTVNGKTYNMKLR